MTIYEKEKLEIQTTASDKAKTKKRPVKWRKKEKVRNKWCCAKRKMESDNRAMGECWARCNLLISKTMWSKS